MGLNGCVYGTSPGVVVAEVNPKAALGDAKPSMSLIPPAALLHMGAAMKNGAAKYGALKWREVSLDSTTYYDAAMRHMLAWLDGEDVAPDSGVHHLGHVMACCAIVLDAISMGNLNDNRPTAGKFTELCEAMTHAKEAHA